jgi:hypothetical protein
LHQNFTSGAERTLRMDGVMRSVVVQATEARGRAAVARCSGNL